MAELRIVRKRLHKGCGGKVRFDGRKTYACERCGMIKAAEVAFDDFNMDENTRLRHGRATA